MSRTTARSPRSRPDRAPFLAPAPTSSRARASNNIYFAALVETAAWGRAGHRAAGTGERGHIYIVEPVGPFEDDPNVTNKRFPGNPTQSLPVPQPAARRRRAAELARPRPRGAEKHAGPPRPAPRSRGWTSSRTSAPAAASASLRRATSTTDAATTVAPLNVEQYLLQVDEVPAHPPPRPRTAAGRRCRGWPATTPTASSRGRAGGGSRRGYCGRTRPR